MNEFAVKIQGRSGWCARSMLLLSLLSACNTMQSMDTTTPASSNPLDNVSTGSPSASFDLNGTWRYGASGAIGPGCLTIAGLRVTTFDDGCNGNNLTLVNRPPAYTYDSHADVYCTYNVSPTDPSNYGAWSFSLDLQDDGSLSGMATRRIEPGAQVTTVQVVWRRQ